MSEGASLRHAHGSLWCYDDGTGTGRYRDTPDKALGLDGDA